MTIFFMLWKPYSNWCRRSTSFHSSIRMFRLLSCPSSKLHTYLSEINLIALIPYFIFYWLIMYQSNVFSQPRIIPNLPIGIDESTEIDNEWTVVSFQSTKSQLRYSRHKSQSSNKYGNREEQSPSLQSRY